MDVLCLLSLLRRALYAVAGSLINFHKNKKQTFSLQKYYAILYGEADQIEMSEDCGDQLLSEDSSVCSENADLAYQSPKRLEAIGKDRKSSDKNTIIAELSGCLELSQFQIYEDKDIYDEDKERMCKHRSNGLAKGYIASKENPDDAESPDCLRCSQFEIYEDEDIFDKDKERVCKNKSNRSMKGYIAPKENSDDAESPDCLRCPQFEIYEDEDIFDENKERVCKNRSYGSTKDYILSKKNSDDEESLYCLELSQFEIYEDEDVYVKDKDENRSNVSAKYYNASNENSDDAKLSDPEMKFPSFEMYEDQDRSYEDKKQEYKGKVVESSLNNLKSAEKCSERRSVEEEKNIRRQENYERRKNCIKDDIKFDFTTMLLVWCPRELVNPDFIVSTLGRFDPDVGIRSKWSGLSSHTSNLVFGGVIAEFTVEDSALQAAKELSMLSRSVMVLRLSQFLDFIIDAELRHPMFRMHSYTGNTRVLVRGSRFLIGGEEYQEVGKVLGAFGDVKDRRFYDESEYQNQGIVCEVTYEYASQAYAAVMYLDGFFFSPTLRLTLHVLVNRYDKAIMRTVRSRMIDLVDENRFVPL